MAANTVHRATQTNFAYRLVDAEDLTAGRDGIIMLSERDYPIDPTTDPAILGTRIRLDDPPVRNIHLIDFVFYHIAGPYSIGQCYVGLRTFTGQVPGDTHYWIPITSDPDPVRIVDQLLCACGDLAEGTSPHGLAICSNFPDCLPD